MKRTLSFILTLVLLIGLMPMQALAIENEPNPWEGRSAVFVGDSITAGSGTTKIYYEYLEESLGFDSVTPMGVAGSCVSAASDYGQSNQPLISRYQNIPSADLIVIFMGTNDYGHETPLGSVEDTQDGTFYGALNVIIPALVENHPSSKLVFVTPMHRYGFGTSKILGTAFTYDSIANGVGATLGEYVDALKTVCANNGVSVIDLYTECTLDPADAETRTNYMPDGLHPNAAGHEVVAGIIESHIRGFEPTEQEPVELTEMVYGNRFAAGNDQTCRASSRINYYLKAGTVITLKDSAAMQWACAKTSDETSSSNLGYFPDSGWSDKETAVVETDGWVGFVFKYRDETQAFDLTSPLSDYITIEEPHTHSYENGVCTGCGATTSPYLQQLPDNITGCSNLYDILTPTKGYYTATKYDTSNGAVLSVVIPVEPGDRIAASSFGPVSENMGSVDGIRVTYLLDGAIVESLSASTVYTTYTQNGYLTVPEGVNMVSVPWWKPSDSNWLTLSQISKSFASHSPKTVSAQVPTCTENGYTAGEICEICGASLGTREEIPAAGHNYDGDTCTVCGTVNILAILDGNYVSILGDSISTFNGYSNDATVNTTIGGNAPRYDAGAADTKPGSYCLLESVDDTWWMHFANRSGMKLLVNNSWAGSQVFGGQTSDGRVIPAAYLERCINLHDNTLNNNPGNAPINPDVIFVYLGINDYNFNRSNVGEGAVDYASLINPDGTYVTPVTFGKAYGIMLHKMQQAYPDAQIFAMTLLPENLFSVDKTAWEQHNAYIRAAAEYYDIPVVDLAEKCAITWDNYSGYMMDKIHPTTAGMELISDCIEAELVAHYTANPPHANGPFITQQPESVEQEIGKKFAITVKAEGEGLTYQWYVKEAGAKAFKVSVNKTSSYAYTMQSYMHNRQVYCVITDANGNSVTTETATITRPPQALKITRQPQDVQANVGEKFSIKPTVQGDGLTYQWYVKEAGAKAFKVSSNKTSAYAYTMQSYMKGRQVYCVITDKYGNSVTTEVATISLPPVELKILEQPTDVYAAKGEKFSIKPAVQGDGLTYQWYVKEAGAKAFKVSSNTRSAYAYTMQDYMNGRQVYCVITDQYGNQVVTEVVTIHAEKN